MKVLLHRIFDIFFAAIGLILTSPFISLAILSVYLTDFKNPFYVSGRIGKNGVPFKMLKIRTMIVGADKTGIDSTSKDDQRVTPVGHLIRKIKLDEIIQLFNILTGDMTIVGPRPNVARETSLYTEVEKKLLSVKPGITDLSSIVFSDLAEILKGSEDANLKYCQYVRPWKSRLSLFHIEKCGFRMNLAVMGLTALLLASRKMALQGIVKILRREGAPPELIEVAKRDKPLVPFSPPGNDEIARSG